MQSIEVALRATGVERQAPPADSAGVGIAHIEIFDDFAAAAPDWDWLAGEAIASPFGQRAWIEAWHRHIGAPAGFSVVRDVRLDGQTVGRVFVRSNADQLEARVWRTIGITSVVASR